MSKLKTMQDIQSGLFAILDATDSSGKLDTGLIEQEFDRLAETEGMDAAIAYGRSVRMAIEFHVRSGEVDGDTG